MTQLTSSQKAAVLLLILEEKSAVQVMKQLNERELEQICLEIANLGKVTPEMIKGVAEEFSEMCLADKYINSGGIEHARSLMEKALGPTKAKEIINHLTASLQVRPFDSLRKTDPVQLLEYIQNEHPQTIALVLAHLNPEQAAGIIAGLAPGKQTEVAYRMAVMDSTSPDIIKEVEHIMEKKLSALVSQDYTNVGGVNSVVEVLNRVDRSTEKMILETLDDKDPDLAEQIKKQLFVFEDIVRLDDRYVQLVLSRIDQRDLALALKGVASNVYEKIEKNMSKRAAQNLKEELEFMGPVRIRGVEEAQQRIVSVIRKLEEQGEIIISRGDEDQVVL
ncbi:MAG TPA: flagellar motor switch protein FliG [Peptococcaceae bacterium]|nr:flagellar motor switch protein FliG [Peptococcaceae bacterium]